jgi:hypothetical protein
MPGCGRDTPANLPGVSDIRTVEIGFSYPEEEIFNVRFVASLNDWKAILDILKQGKPPAKKSPLSPKTSQSESRFGSIRVTTIKDKKLKFLLFRTNGLPNFFRADDLDGEPNRFEGGDNDQLIEFIVDAYKRKQKKKT